MLWYLQQAWYVERLSTLLSFECSGSEMADWGIGVDGRLSGSRVRLVVALGGTNRRPQTKAHAPTSDYLRR